MMYINVLDLVRNYTTCNSKKTPTIQLRDYE